MVADGEQGGTRNTDTYLLIANTASSPGRARVTLLFEDGSSAVREVEVAANSRTTVWTGGTEDTPSSLFGGMTSGRRFGAVIESLPVNGQAAGIVVERAMYGMPTASGGRPARVRWGRRSADAAAAHPRAILGRVGRHPLTSS